MLAMLGTTALAAPASAAPVAPLSDPVYDYTTAIRETVYVETTLDNDGNGTPTRSSRTSSGPAKPPPPG
ncbi:hypothetical protein ACFQZ4_45225 [Catellatospora coxensis]